MKALIILIFPILLSCKSIVGFYVYQQPFVYQSLLLRPDSTFVFFIQGDVGLGDTTKGNWKFINNNVVLNSFIDYAPYQVYESTISNSESVHFSIEDIYDWVPIGSYITLNDNDSVKYVFHEKGEIELGSINSVENMDIYSHEGLYTYTVIDTSANKFDIRFDVSPRFYLKNQCYRPRFRKLELPEGGLVLKRKRSFK